MDTITKDRRMRLLILGTLFRGRIRIKDHWKWLLGTNGL